MNRQSAASFGIDLGGLRVLKEVACRPRIEAVGWTERFRERTRAGMAICPLFAPVVGPYSGWPSEGTAGRSEYRSASGNLGAGALKN